MPIAGDRVQFAYISGSSLPSEVDAATFYVVAAAQQLYLGSQLIASVTSAGTFNYNGLDNKPQLDGTILQGDVSLTSLHVPHILSDTVAGWAAKSSLQSQEGYLYVYTDHQTISGVNVPGLKIGDGSAYLIDLPFIDAVYADHIANTIIHVTQADRARWDSKVTCFIDPNKSDKLVFSTE